MLFVTAERCVSNISCWAACLCAGFGWKYKAPDDYVVLAAFTNWLLISVGVKCFSFSVLLLTRLETLATCAWVLHPERETLATCEWVQHSERDTGNLWVGPTLWERHWQVVSGSNTLRERHWQLVSGSYTLRETLASCEWILHSERDTGNLWMDPTLWQRHWQLVNWSYIRADALATCEWLLRSDRHHNGNAWMGPVMKASKPLSS